MALTSINIKTLLINFLWLVLATEAAKLVQASTANVTRGSKQIVFLYPSLPVDKGLYVPTRDNPSSFQQQPRQSFLASPPGTSNADEMFFGGNSNLLTGRIQCPLCPSCPACPSCASCPTCPTCPSACPATTNAAFPLEIDIPEVGSCSDSTNATATSYGACSRVSAAPSGVFSIIYPKGPSATATGIPTAFIAILATCPNTKVTVRCGAIPANWLVTTQTGQQIGGAKAVPSGQMLVDETSGFMQLMVRLANTAAAGSLQCSWYASA